MLPEDLQVSKFRFYSLGVVAANKAMSTHVIEVTPVEELTMLDGDINATEADVTADGVLGDGSHYSSAAMSGNSLQAQWLPFGSTNRRTSPDVRRGERVIIYQFGDTDKYYWTTLMDDFRLRKLETVIWGISATPNEGAEPGHDNMYYLEVSSHNKLIALHTSQANDEPYGYDIQINTKDGRITFQDTAGQEILLDSAARQLYLKNSDGSLVEINKTICNINASDEVNITTSKYTLQADNATTQASEINVKGGTTTISGDALNVTTATITLD